MLKATLIAILLCSVVDAVAFGGEYRLMTFHNISSFFDYVGRMDWAGFLT